MTIGGWERVDPIGTTNGGVQAQPEDDNPAGTGTICYVTQNGLVGGAAGTTDVDGGPTQLTSPAINLTGAADPVIGYYRWVYCSTGADDQLIVEVSNNNGTNWTTVESAVSAPSWTAHSFHLTDYVAPTAQVRLRFSIADNPNGSVTEAAVDDVTVKVFQCVDVPIPGDIDADGDVDQNDRTLFIQVLLKQDVIPAHVARSDMNASGAADADDIRMFVAALLG
jgi:hypothetical protein